MVIVTASKPTTISIIRCKPAPITHLAARFPAVALTAAVGSTVPAVAFRQLTVSMIGRIDGSTLVGTRGRQGNGELYTRDKEVRESHN